MLKNNKLKIDFLSSRLTHRIKFGGGANQALPKAVGIKNNKNALIIDATAGLGRDSFLLASLGAKIIMIERSKEIYLALNEAMNKALEAGGEVARIIEHMQLIHADARDLLPKLNGDIILVDPMHPERQKSALVKQEMRLLRDIVGADNDKEELIKIALLSANKKMVLKWPKNAQLPLFLPKPNYQIAGKTTRFVVFVK